MNNILTGNYRHYRAKGLNAYVSLNKARAETAANIRHYVNHDIQYNPQSKDGLRWVENISYGLRFVKFADEIAARGIQHKGWFTAEESICTEVLRGAVYRLPHGKLLAGYADPNNEDCARVDFSHIYRDELDAAYAADRIAEKTAECEREYNEAFQAGCEYHDKQEEIKTHRHDLIELVKAIRVHRKDKVETIICETLRAHVRSHLSDIRTLQRQCAKLIADFSVSWRKDTHETFNDGAECHAI